MKKSVARRPDWMLALLALRRDYEVAEIGEMLRAGVSERTVTAWLAGEYKPLKPRRRQLIEKAEKHAPHEYARLQNVETERTEKNGN